MASFAWALPTTTAPESSPAPSAPIVETSAQLKPGHIATIGGSTKSETTTSEATPNCGRIVVGARSTGWLRS